MELSEVLAADEYIRQRLHPRPGDPDYLCLIDLLDAVRAMAPLDAERVLDYGCGGSPYRSLFRGGVYHRADLAGGVGLDFEYGADSRLPANIEGYDLVLSSQVLEHVVDPAFYLSECFRVLKPGGRLLITTHGTFWDHACPHDYWRWTAYGLRKAVEAQGFTALQSRKITTGSRAALFLFEQRLDAPFERAGFEGRALAALFSLIRRFGAERRHRLADIVLPDECVVDAQGEGEAARHALYIGVGILAQKQQAE